MKISIIYWTGTGNTQMMAETIVDTVEELGFNPIFEFVNDVDLLDVKESEWFFLGCPAMTGEDIEELEFRPFFESLKESLQDKNVVLFGSYDWGDGQWIETWSQEVEEAGGKVKELIKVQWNPEDEQLAMIKESVMNLFS